MMLGVMNAHNLLANGRLQLTILVAHFGQDKGALLARLGLDRAQHGAYERVGHVRLGLTSRLDRDGVDERGHLVNRAHFRGGIGQLILLDLIDLNARCFGQFGFEGGDVGFHCF